MPGPLESIVALHLTNVQLNNAKQRLHGIPDWMRELHEEHSGHREKIAEIEDTIEAAGRERRAAEGEVEEAREKQRRYQQQINEVSTQREYGALLQEIDTVKEQINQGEERALACMEQVETLTRELESEREAFQEVDERYSVEQEKWEAEKPGVAQEVAELERKVEGLRERLPRRIVALFDRLDERLGGAPLAMVRSAERPGKGPAEWHCGACNYRVRPQVVVQIRNEGTLVQCDSCKRILYMEEDMAGEAGSQNQSVG